MRTNTIITTIKYSNDQTEQILVRDPYTLNVVASLQVMKNEIDYKRRIKLGTDLSNLSWSKTYKGLANFLKMNMTDIATIATEETGSPIKYHLQDIQAVVEYINKQGLSHRYWKNTCYRIPKGVILFILSANEPIILSIIPILEALRAGNCVLVKPSSKSPSVSYMVVKELIHLGVSPYTLHYLPMSRSAIKSTIQNTKSINLVISFNSSNVNRLLRAMCAQNNIDLICENEGNDWAYIDGSNDSCDLNILASEISRSFTKHNGQMCDAIRGVLVHQSIYQEFKTHLQDKINQLVNGSPLDASSDIGAMIQDTLNGIDKLCQSKNQKSHIWNGRLGQNILRPTLICNPKMNEAFISTPFFGPLIWIKSVNKIEYVINYYNKYNKHGLCFSIYSKNKEAINLLLSKINVGRININVSHVDVALTSPWGGIKLSGSEGPRTWYEKFSNAQVINTGQYSKF